MHPTSAWLALSFSHRWRPEHIHTVFSVALFFSCLLSAMTVRFGRCSDQPARRRLRESVRQLAACSTSIRNVLDKSFSLHAQNREREAQRCSTLTISWFP